MMKNGNRTCGSTALVRHLAACVCSAGAWWVQKRPTFYDHPDVYGDTIDACDNTETTLTSIAHLQLGKALLRKITVFLRQAGAFLKR